MGYPPRPLDPGAIIHAIARGNNREMIFRPDDAAATFLAMLDDVAAHRAWRGIAYCVMGNHVHLTMQLTDGNLDDGMRDLLGRFARHYNRRAGRIGHVFQGRYRCKAVRDDDQLFTTIRYVLRNPVAAGLTEDPYAWRWSSLGPTMQASRRTGFLDAHHTLGLFHHRPWIARHRLHLLVDADQEAGATTPEAFPPPAAAVPSPGNAGLALGSEAAAAFLARRGEPTIAIVRSLGISRVRVDRIRQRCSAEDVRGTHRPSTSADGLRGV